jgi:hypothetical protein
MFSVYQGNYREFYLHDRVSISRNRETLNINKECKFQTKIYMSFGYVAYLKEFTV